MRNVLLISLMCLLLAPLGKASNVSPIWQTSSEGPVYDYIIEPDSPRDYYDNGGPDRNMRGNFALTIVQLKPALSNYHITVVFEEMDMGNDILKIYNGAVELYNGPNEDGEYTYDWPKTVEPIYSKQGDPEKLPLVISSTDPSGVLTVGNLNFSETKGWKAKVYCVKNGSPEPGGVTVEEKPEIEFAIIEDLGVDADDEPIDDCTVSMQVGAAADNTVIQIDWGNGTKRDYTIPVKDEATSISALVDGGATVKIYGDLTLLDLSGNRTVESIVFNKKDKTPALQVLRLAQNKISQLYLNDLLNLKELSVSDNKISEMNISYLEKLEEFYGAYNPYTKLRTTTCPNLSVITCYNTYIKELDLSQNKELLVLTAGDNVFDVIPSLENNLKLVSLDLERVNLGESIDLSKLSELKKLNLAYTNLATLDLSNNVALYDLNLVGNKFDACTINDILFTLPKATDDSFVIRLAKNPGIAEAQTDLAKQSGWTIDSEGNGEGCSTIKLRFLPSENGTFTTKVGEKEYKEMEAIAKGMTVTVLAAPEKDYELDKIVVNGVDVDRSAVNEATFEAAQYSSLAAVFVLATSIQTVEQNNNVMVCPTSNGFEIGGLNAGESYSVYDMSGRLLMKDVANAEGVATVGMAATHYAVFKSATLMVKLVK